MTAPKHLRLLRPFALLALAAGAVGTSLGFVILEKQQWLRSGFVYPWRQVHAQLQIFGFLIPFITGFGMYLVPRLAGGRPVERRRLARFSLGAQGLGLLAVLAAATVPSDAVLRRIAAVAVLCGTAAAAWALRGPIVAHAREIGGRAKVGYLWIFELSLWLLFAAGIADAVALWTAAGERTLFVDLRWAAAAWRLGIEGFGVGMALGVSARMFTGFLGIDPSRAYPSERSAYQRRPGEAEVFWAAMGAWAASVLVAAGGELAGSLTVVRVADLLFAAGALSFAFRLGLGRTPKGLAIDRAQDPYFPIGARGSYALLSLGALIGAGSAIAGFAGLDPAPIWADARRHAITIGYLLALIATMAGRLAPGYSGRKLFGPKLRLTAITAFVASGLLRTFEGAAAQWGTPPLLWLSAASGVLALIGFAALVAALAATLVTGPKVH